MTNQHTQDTPPGLAPLEFLHDPEYVLGFPAHVAVVLRCDRPNGALNRLPYADLMGTNGFLGLDLAEPGRPGSVRKVEPLTVVDEDLGHATFHLGMGEARRILFDISEFLPENLAPGSYSMILSYGFDNGKVQSPPSAVKFRSPTPEEKALLQDWQGEMREAGSWREWIRRPPEDSENSRGLATAGPLGFSAALRHLIHVPELLPQDGRILDAAAGVCRPEAEVLKAEVFQAGGDIPGYRHAADEILSTHPELFWMVRKVEQGTGILASARASVR